MSRSHCLELNLPSIRTFDIYLMGYYLPFVFNFLFVGVIIRRYMRQHDIAFACTHTCDRRLYISVRSLNYTDLFVLGCIAFRHFDGRVNSNEYNDCATMLFYIIAVIVAST